jgi:Zn-dependent membrane protease YugP
MSSVFGDTLAWIGVFVFGLTAIFSIVTLTVEFIASGRAK